MANTARIVDQLAVVRAQITRLQLDAAGLSDLLKEQGPGTYRGEETDATATVFDSAASRFCFLARGSSSRPAHGPTHEQEFLK